jgi:PilZ domain
MSIEQRGIRSGTRIPIELPVSIRWKNPAGIERNVQAKTGDISGNGLLILMPVRLRHGTPLQFTIALPSEVTGVPVQLRCQGRVVRQQPRKASAGVGIVIDDYQLLTMRQAV